MTTSTQESPKGDLEGAIIDAARDLIVEGGLGALSMRAVGERVGVSATAIYHYFQGKQELVDRVVRCAFAQFGHDLEEAMLRHPKGSIERVVALGRAYIQFALENRASFRVIFSIQLPDPRELEDLPGGGGYPLVRQSVVDAIEAGTMRAGDPDLVTLYLWSTVHGLVTLVLACRLKGCACEGEESEDKMSPVDLFAAFEPYVREGILASGREPLENSEIESGAQR